MVEDVERISQYWYLLSASDLEKIPDTWGMASSGSSNVRAYVKPLKLKMLYLVGGLEHLDYFCIYWEFHHPN